ncbi:MAG: Rrf2 family transcriptional regulator [Candidatus Omnitrophica bacterium]|nr:Rrf2 family transcriptional regulator [Candidatus Omnitrophota bacterium]
MQIYSKTCEYALRALVYLALKGKGVFIGASEISEATGIPGPYLTKIFQNLTRRGFLKSRRGVSGGVALCHQPEDVSLIQIVEAIDDLTPFDECVMGLDQCEDHNGCPLHPIWSNAKNEIFLKLKTTSLMDLTKNSKKMKYRRLRRQRLLSAFSDDA